jgi:hypothetical protein
MTAQLKYHAPSGMYLTDSERETLKTNDNCPLLVTDCTKVTKHIHDNLGMFVDPENSMAGCTIQTKLTDNRRLSRARTLTEECVSAQY